MNTDNRTPPVGTGGTIAGQSPQPAAKQNSLTVDIKEVRVKADPDFPIAPHARYALVVFDKETVTQSTQEQARVLQELLTRFSDAGYVVALTEARVQAFLEPRLPRIASWEEATGGSVALHPRHPFIEAVKQGDLKTMSYWLNSYETPEGPRQLSPDVIECTTKMPVLSIAIQAGQQASFDLLLEKGANFMGKGATSPLYVAAVNDRLDMAKELYFRGVGNLTEAYLVATGTTHEYFAQILGW